MNFIAAIQHATIGYGIRRKLWDKTLHLDNHDLYWMENGNSCEILGKDPGVDLTAEDLKATDWEAI